MKLTFKQFLEDITIDDDAYTKTGSDDAANGVGDYGNRIVNTKWKSVPLKKPFPIAGFSVKYNSRMSNWGDGRLYDIALIDDANGALAVHIDCRPKRHSVPGGSIIGLVTEQLSSHKDYRGRGLVVALYQCLAENGQNLFSATLQTSGGASVWKRLVHRVDAEVYVVMPTYAAIGKQFKVPRGLDLDHYDYVLVKGAEEQLNRAAYDTDGDAFWFVTPGINNSMKKYVVTT